MPSIERNIVQLVSKAIQYTGSNSADIDNQVPNCSIVSESGGILTINASGNIFTMVVNDWVAWNGIFTTVLTNTQYLNEWGCVGICSEISTINSQIATLQSNVSTLQTNVSSLQTAVSSINVGTPVRSLGVSPVPTLIVGASTTVAVTLIPAMPDATYSPQAFLFAGISIVGLQINSTTVVNASTVNVVVQNVGLVSLSGSNVLVIGRD